MNDVRYIFDDLPHIDIDLVGAYKHIIKERMVIVKSGELQENGFQPTLLFLIAS